MLHTPDVVTLAGAAVEILVAEEAGQVDVVALVLASGAIDALDSVGLGVVVNVEYTISAILDHLVDLALVHNGHGDGVGRVESLQALSIELAREDALLRGHGTRGHAGEEDGRNSGLHDCNWQRDGIEWRGGERSGSDDHQATRSEPMGREAAV